MKSGEYPKLNDRRSGVRNKHNLKRKIQTDCFETHNVYNVVSIFGKDGLPPMVNLIEDEIKDRDYSMRNSFNS